MLDELAIDPCRPVRPMSGPCAQSHVSRTRGAARGPHAARTRRDLALEFQALHRAAEGEA
jgi:hypothetical protein